MKVLMFGWEFPPHITGGLGTACYGITKAMSGFPEMDLTFVVPKAWGDEPKNQLKVIGANQINLIESKIKKEQFFNPFTYLSVQSKIVPYVDPKQYIELLESRSIESIQSKMEFPESIQFTGKYTPDLMTEIHNFSVVGEYIAANNKFDVIHSHDWLTFPAGIRAKKMTGKPLVVHVHATDFDRSGGNANPEVYAIERAGMEAADRVITVSDHTGNIVREKYGIDASKIVTVHNGVEPYNGKISKKISKKRKTKIVTFLGRVTMQKGPGYFVEVAQKVLEKMDNVMFVMAGSGDMLNPMIDLVRQSKLSDKFIFPGFLKGNQVREMLCISDVFIMPSVSEPFGICPLEAMYCKVPSIISLQSGVSEVVRHVVKVDFWDTDAMADAVYSILKRPVLRRLLVKNGANEVRKVSWDKTAIKIINVYDQLIRA